MKDIKRDDVVELAAETQCAVCKTPYGHQGVRILGQRGSAWIIAVTCKHCDAEGLMIATVEEDETGALTVDQETESRPKIMYDVTYDEWLAFQEMPPISQDDVLDAHLFLEEFRGDFDHLFSKLKTEENVKSE